MNEDSYFLPAHRAKTCTSLAFSHGAPSGVGHRAPLKKRQICAQQYSRPHDSLYNA